MCDSILKWERRDALDVDDAASARVRLTVCLDGVPLCQLLRPAPQRRCPRSSSELQLPRHMRIFTFGSSYMRQLAVQLICADDPGSTNTFDAIRPDPHALTWTVVMSNNVTLTNVANDPELSRRPGWATTARHLLGARTLRRRLLHESAPSVPLRLPTGQEAWMGQLFDTRASISTMQNKKESRDACVRGTASDDDASLPKCLQAHDEGFAPSRFLATVRQHVPHVYEVAPWVPDGPSPQQRLAASNHSDRTSLVLPWAVWGASVPGE